MNDFRFAWRQLLKNPGFTVVAVLTLALGIGATTAMFSIVDGVLLKPLPYEQPGQLVQVFEAPEPGQRNAVSPGAFLDWKQNCTVFEDLSLLENRDMNLTGEGEPARVSGLGMSAASLRILRARPLLGRIFLPDDEKQGAPWTVVLTHGFWQRQFGGDPNVVGRTLRLDDHSHTIIGVLPPRFLPWNEANFIVPSVVRPGDENQRSSHWLRVIGRLKPGETVERAQAELATLALRLRPLYPAQKKEWSYTVVAMQEQLTRNAKPTLLVLFGAVGFVLLIACANVANLLLSRASRRQKEMAIRVALGAGRWRVMRQLLVESVMLSGCGALLGLGLAAWGVSLLGRLVAVNLPRAQEVGLDWRVLGFALLVSLLAGLAFGLVPALRASRPDLNDVLKDGSRTGGSGSRNRFRGALIVTEVALSLVLLVGAGLLLNSFIRVAQVPSGVNPANVLTMQITLPNGKYPDAERRAAFHDQVLERIQALPGVEAAGVTGVMPVAGWIYDTTFTVVGRATQPDSGYSADFDFSTPGFFPAAGIQLRSGRFFAREDQARKSRVVLINETLARQYFPNQDPVGQQLKLEVFSGNPSEAWEIIGVVGDVRQRGQGERLRPCVYRPQVFSFTGGGANLLVRASGSSAALAAAVRKAVLEVDPGQPVANVRPLQEVLGNSVAQRRFVLGLLGGFAGSALLLAAIGLYGVIAYAVSQRTRELGIRLALGATRRDVLHLILVGGLKLAGLGAVIGIVASLGLSRLLANLLYDVKPTDVPTFAGVSVLLLVVAAFASWVPARRAARVDPMVALRTE